MVAGLGGGGYLPIPASKIDGWLDRHQVAGRMARRTKALVRQLEAWTHEHQDEERERQERERDKNRER